jgi:dihydrofolate reductase
MSKVLWHVTMSLDGFIARRDNSTEWMFADRSAGPAGPMGGEVVARTGAILAGRTGYDLGTRAGSGPRAIYGGAWSGPVFVLTHRAGDTDPGVTFLSCSIEEAVGTARAAADGKDVGVFGADLARQCIRSGLVDEIFVHLVPVLLGDGLRLFSDAASPLVRLRKTRGDNTGQITDLSFEVLR